VSRYHRGDQPARSMSGPPATRQPARPDPIGAPSARSPEPRPPGPNPHTPPPSAARPLDERPRTAAPPAAPPDDGAHALRRLRIIGIVLPVAFIVALELCRFTGTGHRLFGANDDLILAAFTVGSVVVFASVMFYLIDRVHRVVLRQNRQLAAVNTVSTTVRGDLGVNEIIEAALTSVVSVTGARQASITAADPRGRSPHDTMTTWRRVGPHGGTADGARVVDIPLATGTAEVGTMRLVLPRGGEPDRLTAEALRTIGQQVGSAVNTAQLVADLQRRKREGHALYDVLLKISHQSSPVDTLVPVVRYARDLLGSDEAVLCLSEATSRFVQIDGALGAPPWGTGPVCIAPEAAEVRASHAKSCPIRGSAEFRATMDVPLDGPGGPFGQLWIGRRSDTPFTGRDHGYLVTLSEIAVIAITSARMRENERQGAIIAERERIAREMHDSLAQVLGVTHLRLHALRTRAEVGDQGAVGTELADLADLCQDAYRDVREAILGLRESSRTDRALLESLRAYLEKYTRQCGIATSLRSDVGDDLTLAPRSEIHLIRVIQEALTNVRKHSGARSVVVRVSASGPAVTFVVEDDGHGFDMTEVPPDRDGFGLHSMSERMRLLNGSLTIDSRPGRGTRVIATVPAPGRATEVPAVSPDSVPA
jgi:signal transduction histidine kinase